MPSDPKAGDAGSLPPRPPRYRTGDAGLDAAIEDVARRLAEIRPREADRASTREAAYAREIMTTAAKLVIDGADIGDVKLTNSALKELRWAYRVFKPWRAVRKVTVFGSARTTSDAPAYAQALDLGRRMAELGWMVITGAGGGIMEAAHGGAGREASFGVNIQLPFEQAANETVRGDDKLVNFKYFFTRKLTFLKETDGIVLFPGGFGTHDEGFETLTLLQTGKADPMPVVFVEPPGSGYWREWQHYVERHLAAPGLISPDDTQLYRITDDVSRAIDEVTGFYRVYHSQRYVGTSCVLRLQCELAPERLDALNVEFARLLRKGRIEQAGALPDEAGQPEIAHLPRLVFDFRRDDFSGLRLLIDRINETAPEQLSPVHDVGPRPEEERAERGAVPGAAEPADDPDPASGAQS